MPPSTLFSALVAIGSNCLHRAESDRRGPIDGSAGGARPAALFVRRIAHRGRKEGLAGLCRSVGGAVADHRSGYDLGVCKHYGSPTVFRDDMQMRRMPIWRILMLCLIGHC
jgi:hypothetical protein